MHATDVSPQCHQQTQLFQEFFSSVLLALFTPINEVHISFSTCTLQLLMFEHRL